MPEAIPIVRRTEAEEEVERRKNEGQNGRGEDGDELEEEEEVAENGRSSDGALDTMKTDTNERSAPSKATRAKTKTSSPATGAAPKKRRKVNHGEKSPYPESHGAPASNFYNAPIANRSF